ncbi:MAG: carboxypeptidase regulatory-like domain-containing protein [Blastocatellia bacterium]
MSKLGFVLSILALPLALLSIQAQPAETKAGAATVSGRVTLKNEPARGVTVLLQGQTQGPSNSSRAKTDENGRFRFTGVAAGRYSIFALAPGYISSGDDYLGRRGQTLNIAEGEKIENIDLEIRRGGVIAGRITDSGGRPVIEEMVNLSKLDKDNQPRSYWGYNLSHEMYRTDDRGFYRIFGLPEGRYLVSVGQAQRPGSASITSSRLFYPRVFYPDATSEAEAKVVEVSEGSEAADIDITVPDPKQTYDVYGRVVDADTGQLVPNVEVVVGGLSQDGRPTGGWAGTGERSRPNGEFHLVGVLPGRYALSIRPDEKNDSGFISEPTILDLSGGDATGVEVKVRQGASISGVVIIEGASDPKILAKLSRVNLTAYVSSTTSGQPAFWRRDTVKADGSFRIRGLQPGKAVISLEPSPETRGLTLARIEHNGAAPRDGIDVGAGEHVTGVRVVLVYSALAIRGEVKIIGGALPPGFRLRVTARRMDQPAQITQGVEVDARGQFVFENMPAGEYEVRVMPSYTTNSQRLDPQTERLILSVKERVVVSSDHQQPVAIVIDLSRKEGNR